MMTILPIGQRVMTDSVLYGRNMVNPSVALAKMLAGFPVRGQPEIFPAPVFSRGFLTLRNHTCKRDGFW